MSKSHDENCAKVCAICWRKCLKRGSANQVKYIKEFFIENYDPHLSHFPSGVCASCSAILYSYARGNFHRIPNVPDDFYPGRIILKPNATCHCRICTIARKTRWKGMASRSGKRKRSAASQPPTFKVCSKCFGLIYRGMLPLFFMIASIGCAHPSHQCISRKKLISNHVELMQSKGEKTFGQILSSALRTFDLNSSDITLPTFGKPLNVSLTTAKSVRKFLTSDDCINLKSLADLSDRKLIIVLQHIRRVFGRAAIEPGISRFLTNRKNMFSDLFDCTIIPLCVASGETSDICVVYCLSIPAFIERVCALRGIDQSEARIHIGIDYGKSFLKITLAIPEPTSSTSTKKLSGFKLSGSMKTLLLAVCQAPETYANLQSIIQLLKIPSELDITYIGDLKLLNIVTGVGSHSSAHPCTYCISPASNWDEAAQLRTLQMNSEQFELWRLTSGQKSQRRNFFSCSNSPTLDSNRTVLLLCPPPPLHLKLGLTNLLVRK